VMPSPPPSRALSLSPSPTPSRSLPRLLPRSLALEVAMAGDPIDAERAYAFGMVNQLVEPGVDHFAGLDQLIHHPEAIGPFGVDGVARHRHLEGDVAGKHARE